MNELPLDSSRNEEEQLPKKTQQGFKSTLPINQKSERNVVFSSSKSASPEPSFSQQNNITESRLNMPTSDKEFSTFYLTNDKLKNHKRKLIKLNKVPPINLPT